MNHTFQTQGKGAHQAAKPQFVKQQQFWLDEVKDKPALRLSHFSRAAE